MIYLDLLLGFLEVGFFSFGGGYAAIPLISDVVRAHGWLDEEMLAYMIAISESTPGPLMVNMATYVGSLKGGALGAAIATTAVVLPAFAIIILVMAVLKRLLRSRYVQGAMDGLKPCITGIILATGLMMTVKNLFTSLPEDSSPLARFDTVTCIITAALAVIYFGSRKVLKKRMSPFALILVSAAVGVIVYGI